LKAWAKAITQAVKDLQGVTPAPTPTPDPTPTPTPTPATENPWHDPEQLDQGQTGHCVGFGWTQFLNTDPINDHDDNNVAHAVYYEAKIIDGEPKQENGSSVRSGAKAIKNRGRVGAYVFAATMDEIKQWIQTKGPVVVGTDWYNGMFSPDANGFIQPTGTVAGGHCYLLVGWDSNDVLTFQNSWGTNWGLNGYFKMHASDWKVLFDAQGEACAAAELPLV
jgi:hypothetical protein